MMITWKYTLPAFVVPFMFTLNIENGINLLALGETSDIVLATLTACLAIVALVAGVGGWLLKPATWLERGILVVAAGLLLYTGPIADVTGTALLALAIAIHVVRTRGSDEGGPAPVPAT
jgi:TRAP-type uncharacterized transport system fused permease subunit